MPLQNFALHASTNFCAVRRCKILRRTPVQIFAPYAGAKFCATRQFKILRCTPLQNFAPLARCTPVQNFAPHAQCKICAATWPQPYRPCGATIARSYETHAGELAAPVNAIRIWKQEQTNMPGCSASHCAAYVLQNPPNPY